jgi:hypothetical protein
VPATERQRSATDPVSEAIAQAKFKTARLKLMKARNEAYLAEHRADLDIDSNYDEEDETKEL